LYLEMFGVLYGSSIPLILASRSAARSSSATP
jgi:hypothetical protein